MFEKNGCNGDKIVLKNLANSLVHAENDLVNVRKLCKVYPTKKDSIRFNLQNRFMQKVSDKKRYCKRLLLTNFQDH